MSIYEEIRALAENTEGTQKTKLYELSLRAKVLQEENAALKSENHGLKLRLGS